MKTIQELTTTIEELEKRIKAISSGQSTLTQLIAIRDYLNDVQAYLNELNTTFDEHINTCTDYSDDISTIKEQISNINSTLEGMDNVNNQQVTEITEQLNEVTDKINNFLGESTTSLASIETDITTLQTDLATTQDDLETTQNDISSINALLGEHTTTLTNLQTAQTNLSTTQSNQASSINTNTNNISTNSSKISALTSRITTAENNISALTGGVDVGEIDERISLLESGENISQSCCHKQYNYHNSHSTNNTLYTRIELYSCTKDKMIYQNFKLTYTSTKEGTLTIEVMKNLSLTGEKYTIDLSVNPYECTFFRQFIATSQSDTIQFKISATTDISFKTLDFWLFGTNVTIYENNNDLKVVCFDNNIYITRYVNNQLKFGKFSSANDIDLNNLPYSINMSSDSYGINYGIFAPYVRYGSDNLQTNTYSADFLYYENNQNNNLYLKVYDAETGSFSNFNYFSNVSHSGEYVLANYEYNFVIEILNSTPKINTLNSYNGSYGYLNMSTDMPNEWLYVNGDIDNFLSPTMSYRTLGNVTSTAKYSDGYFYYINSRIFPKYIKLCKGGNSATAYKQSDGSTNVYVNFNTYTLKYNIVNTTATFVEKIENCNYVYEVLNTHLIKKEVSNVWTIENLETE